MQHPLAMKFGVNISNLVMQDTEQKANCKIVRNGLFGTKLNFSYTVEFVNIWYTCIKCIKKYCLPCGQLK